MTRERIRLGLVGAGGIAQSYAHVLRDSNVAEVVGVADVRLEAGQALAENLGCQAYPSHEKLVEESSCDAAIVCTPPATHQEICCHLAARGVAVLCEKPLALDSNGARAMLAEAERNGVALTMASKFRYVEDVIRAKSIVASGMLGEIVLFENAFASRVDMSRRWNSNTAVSGGGVLIDNGTHSIDVLRYILGPVEAISAVEGKRIQPLDVEDTVRLFVRTRAGVLANIDLSWSLSKDLESYIDIYGSNGTLRVGWRESRYRPATSPDWIPFGTGYDKVAAFRRMVENFCRALRGEEPLLITAEDALASVLAIEAAYESLRHQRWESVAAAETVPGGARRGR